MTASRTPETARAVVLVLLMLTMSMSAGIVDLNRAPWATAGETFLPDSAPCVETACGVAMASVNTSLDVRMLLDPTDPVSYPRSGTTLNDLSPYGNDGTLSGATWDGDFTRFNYAGTCSGSPGSFQCDETSIANDGTLRPGQVGEDLAVELNAGATTQYFAAASGATGKDVGAIEKAFTVALWVKPTDCANTNDLHVLIQKEYSYHIGCKNEQWYFGTGSGSGTWYNTEWLTTSVPAEDDVWQHVAITRPSSGSGTTFHLNGVASYNVSSYEGDLAGANSQPLTVGASLSGSTGLVESGSPFPGWVDDVRIYTSDRGSTVADDMHTYPTVNDANLNAFFDFNIERHGDTVAGLGNQATGTGAAPLGLSTVVGSPVAERVWSVTTDGSDTVLTFERTVLNAPGGWRVPVGVDEVDLLAVGGGGGGGHGGGGGGGVNATASLSVNATEFYSITVGVGGAAARNATLVGEDGGMSSAFGAVGYGGGAGAVQRFGCAANTDGPGGGASFDATSSSCSANGGVLQGHEGGLSNANTYGGGGGGGGAGSAGQNAQASSAGNANNPGNGGGGGNGVTSTITGTSAIYGGGGGGGANINSGATTTATAASGGSGGGGTGSSTDTGSGTDGTDGLGGGGGGSDPEATVYARGGHGVVIVRYTTVNTDGWTVSTWFNTSTLQGSTIIGTFDDGGTASDVGWALRMKYNGAVYATVGTTGNGSAAWTPDAYLDANRWYHAVMVADIDSTLTLYIDGQQVSQASLSNSGDIRDVANDIYIGSYNGGEYSQPFAGQIGAVLVGAGVLSSSSVGALYTATKGAYSNTTVLNYTSTDFTANQDQSFSTGPVNVTNGSLTTEFALDGYLPSGLTFEISNGTVWGTPMWYQANTTYTVHANNSAGSYTTTFSLTVNPPPPALSFSGYDHLTFTVDSAISTVYPSNTGGSITTCSVEPTLPSGLAIGSTCALSGTPTEVSANTTYTVNGSNAGGYDTATFNLTVNDVVPGTPVYAQSSFTLELGTSVNIAPPTVGGGTVVLWEVSPSLPSGLTLNNTTGAITGTPLSLQVVSSTYTVWANNSGGSASTTFSMSVLAVAPSGLTYSPSALLLTINTTMTPVVPTVTGGAITSWWISEDGPDGLFFGPSNGTIWGTPTELTNGTLTFMIWANNSGGSTATNITLTVVDVAPGSFTYSPENSTLTLGDDLLLEAQYDNSTFGNITSWAISDSLPSGVTFHTNNGTIEGTPSGLWPETAYLVWANNSGGSSVAYLNLTVVDNVPSLSYSSPVDISNNRLLSTITPTISGGSITSWEISPSLPTGLSFGTTNGSIWGTPENVTSNVTYTIYANNSGGSASATLTLNMNWTLTPSVDGASITRNSSIGTDITWEWDYDPLEAIHEGLVTGSWNSCAIDDSGDVYCWGRNGNGQIGNGQSASTGCGNSGHKCKDIPTRTNDLGSDVVALAFGHQHACGLTDGGVVKCWGRNNNGQIGTSGGYIDTPFTVSLGSGRTATSIYAGGSSTCAILDDGSTKCWGHNSDGQLGIGSTSNTNTPTTINSLGSGRTAVSLAMAMTTVCALLDDGSVKCWGDDFHGQLGNGGSNVDINSPPSSAINLGSGRTAKSITAGEYHFCAILDDDSIKCWGSGSNGKLGTGSTGDQTTPTSTSGSFASGRYAVVIDAGYEHTCVILDNGDLTCWGGDAKGQLGNGATTGTKSSLQSAAVDLGAGRTAISVSAGGTHTCAQLDNGQLKCWGNRADGQVGDNGGFNSPSDRTSPSTVSNNNYGGNTYADTGVFPSAAVSGATCGISPALPTGMSLTSGTCAITGTPTGTAVNATYTVWTNISGQSFSGQVWLVVGLNAPVLSYSPTSYLFVNGTAITEVQPINSGGEISGFEISPALPNGLSIGSTNGTIWGTPTVASALTSYTVWGNNSAGSSSTTISIKVETTPTSLSYDTENMTLTKGLAMTTNTATVGGGTPTSWAISPSLPSGLSFSSTTGDISGTPTVLQTSAVTYTVWANNTAGSVNTSLNITINDVAPNSVVYSPENMTLSNNTAMTTNTPAAGGGTVTSWEISPALPSGLSFGSTNGSIWGTPTVELSSTTYTIWANNSGGSTVAYFNLTVVDQVPIGVTYTPSGQWVWVNGTLSTMTPAVIGSGTVTAWTLSPASLPEGAVFNTTTGTVTGTPTQVWANTTYTVEASNSGGSVSTSFWLHVRQQAPSITYNVTNVTLVSNVSSVVYGGTNTGGEVTMGFSSIHGFSEAFCAIDADGQVWCWGENTGRMVNRSASSSSNLVPTLQTLPAGRYATSIGVGYEAACALLDNGSVACWGDADQSSILYAYDGDGYVDPVMIPGLGGDVVATSLEVGFASACVEVASGVPQCWGSNAWWSLGIGTTGGTYSTPVNLTVVPSGRTVMSLSHGRTHACALLDNASVMCWGYNNFGQLGDGTVTSRSSPVWPNMWGRAVGSLEAGYRTTCVGFVDGGAACWGENDDGQLGDGTTTDRRVPTNISGLHGPAVFTSFSLTYDTSCALLGNGTTVCWGDEAGQNDGNPRTEPTEVVFGDGVLATSLAGDSSTVCAVLSNASVACWGSGSYTNFGVLTTVWSSNEPLAGVLGQDARSNLGGWYLNGTLPAGMQFSSTNGTLWGTPSEVLPEWFNSTVSVQNDAGTSSYTFSMRIIDSLPTLSYTPANLSLVRGVNGSSWSLAPTLTGPGDITSWVIEPALPSGLFFGVNNGTLYGASSVLQSRTAYTVWANNSGGSTVAYLNLTVVDQLPVLSYASTNLTLFRDGTNPELPFEATLSGGAATSWAISSVLPSGLTFDTTNGSILGNPLVNASLMSYTIWANNTGGSAAFVLNLTVVEPTPGFVYSPTNLTLTRGVAMSPLSPATYGGVAEAWAVHPTLPSGLNFNNGLITGTPNVNLTTTTFTVWANNTQGQASFTLNLTVVEPIVSLSYLPQNVTLYRGIAASTVSPTYSGGAVQTWSIHPSLPAGLSFNNGVISGTPSVNQTTTVYTVWANNTGGSTSATLNLTILEPTVVLTYSAYDITLIRNDTALNLQPSVSWGTPASWSISPTLPTGLSFSQGAFSGTALVNMTRTMFTVWANNSGGSTAVYLNFTVVDQLPVLSYASSNLTLFRDGSNTELPFEATLSGGAPTSWAISSVLPSGLTFDTTNGSILGNPLVNASLMSYTIWANNTGGSASFVLNLTVVEPTPGLVYNPANLTLTRGVAMGPLSPTTTGGVAEAWAIYPTLPSGLNFNNGLITGTPNVNLTTTMFTVWANNSQGQASFTLNLTVVEPVVSLSYASQHSTLYRGIASTAISPTYSGGAVQTWSIHPALPSGLNFTNGVIHGTPTVTVATTMFTVWANNSGGSTSATLNLTVLEPTVVLTYSAYDITLIRNVTTLSLAPSVSGGTPTSWAIEPTLPAGLSFSQGAFSGKALVNLSRTMFTVWANTTGGGTAVFLNFTVVEPVVTLTFNPAEVVLVRNASMNPIAAGFNGGAVDTWSIHPALPEGLQFVNGVLSGSALDNASRTMYTVWANNSGGTSSVMFNLTVTEPMLDFTYTPSTVEAMRGDALTPFGPTLNNDAAVASWGIAPALPSGLMFAEGWITGTPTENATATVYTVWANNSGGASTSQFTLTVLEPVAVVTYEPANFTVTRDADAVLAVPVLAGGSVATWTIDPELPAGLRFDNGTVSGVATNSFPTTMFTVNATNSGGFALAFLNITSVEPLAVLAPIEDLVLVRLGERANASINNSGGAVASWAIEPALPSGVRFTNGQIYGIARVNLTTTTFIVWANNSGGSVSTAFNLTVLEPIANVSYLQTNVNLVAGKTTVRLAPVVEGGVPGSWAIEPALPEGLTFVNGVIAGTSAVNLTPTVFTVWANTTGGSASTTLTLSVDLPVYFARYPVSRFVLDVNETLLPQYPATSFDAAQRPVWSISPALPEGMNFSNGVVWGTPLNASNETTYFVSVTGDMAPLYLTFTLEVLDTVQVEVPDLTNGTIEEEVFIVPERQTFDASFSMYYLCPPILFSIVIIGAMAINNYLKRTGYIEVETEKKESEEDPSA